MPKHFSGEFIRINVGSSNGVCKYVNSTNVTNPNDCKNNVIISAITTRVNRLNVVNIDAIRRKPMLPFISV